MSRESLSSFVLCKFSLFLLPLSAVPVSNLPRYQGPAKTLKHFRLFNYTALAIKKYGALIACCGEQKIKKFEVILFLFSGTGTVEAAIEFLNKGKYLRSPLGQSQYVCIS